MFLRTAKLALKNMLLAPFVEERTDRRFRARKQLGDSCVSIFEGVQLNDLTLLGISVAPNVTLLVRSSAVLRTVTIIESVGHRLSLFGRNSWFDFIYCLWINL
jgi:hypothetical protein